MLPVTKWNIWKATNLRTWFPKSKSDCMHDNCPQCNGSGMKKNGLGPCVHMLSCHCPKCCRTTL